MSFNHKLHKSVDNANKKDFSNSLNNSLDSSDIANGLYQNKYMTEKIS